jgi:hypothetical protein
MKILALETDVPGVDDDAFTPSRLREEATQAWALYQAGTLRELHFRADRSAAVLVLECADVAEARRVLDTLPLVRERLIDFEIVPLAPYPGFERLFEQGG